MTKLCPRGKAAAKRKFKVYPSAYANAYASKICAGKIKDPSGVKRKDFRGRKPAAEGGRIGLKEGFLPEKKNKIFKTESKRKKIMGFGNRISTGRQGSISMEELKRLRDKKAKPRSPTRVLRMGGGLMEATQRLRRQGLKSGSVARGCGAIMSDRRKKTKMV
jgi:hypothetical protein